MTMTSDRTPDQTLDDVRGRAPRPPALDPWSLPPRCRSSYPAPFHSITAGREKRAIGSALGLTRYGVNLVVLRPGAASAARHWHSAQDELVFVLAGEPTLVTDAGEQVLRPGMCAGFPAGRPDGHHLVNRGAREAVYLEIGDRTQPDEVSYPDIDLAMSRTAEGVVFTHRDGRPY